MSSLKYKTNNGYEPLPAMVVRKTNAENGNGIGTCSTSSGTALAVSLTNYELVTNGFVAVTFENDVPAGATLNINGKGAKAIYYKGSAIDGDTIKADDTVTFGYDGTNYVVTSLGGGGSGSIPQEELTISLASNQTADTGLNGATITVTQTGVVEPLYSGTWAGTNIVISIDARIEYTVTVGSVTGYATPAAQTYLSLGNNSRTATFTYNTEVLTVTITKDGGSADISFQTVIVKDASNNTLGTLTNGQSLKIPYGIEYTTTASNISTVDYSRPSPYYVTKDWSDTPEKSLTFTYRYIPNAIDMGLPSGLLWARKNIDVTQNDKFAASEYQYECSFFSWGNTDGHNPSSSSAFSYNWGSRNDTEPYVSSPGAALTGNISASFDAARVNCGTPWRMPTKEEFVELFDNITYIDANGDAIPVGTTSKIVTMNGIAGIRIKSNINSNILFFPCTGYGAGLLWVIRGAGGPYPSCSFNSATNSTCLYFSASVSTNTQHDIPRFRGLAVRAVQ